MIEDILELKNNFEEIKSMGWIMSKRKGSTGVGYTFESLLNLQENSLEIPDYRSIEIKTQRTKSNSYVNLFNAAPDGDNLCEIERLRNNYGYPDKILKNCKIINCDVFANRLKNLGSKYKTKLLVDWQNEKIRLIILDNCLQTVDTKISWSFDLIKEKLFRKLNYLALVKADNKFVDGVEYFRYSELNIYKLKSFNKFIKLIDNGVVKITFKICVVRYGEKRGKTDNHGTSFSISRENLSKLYDNVEFIDNFTL